MKILYLSFYFSPDLCAGSFRNGPLVQALKSKLPANASIDVFTTLPNRYSGYCVDALEKEISGSVTINRIKLPLHKSGMLDQAKAFLAYSIAVKRAVGDEKYDLVFASSSRLMTAALGAWLAKSRKIPLYLDIRDIFVDTLNDVLSWKVSWLITPVFGFFERWTFGAASHINLVSEGFLPYFDKRYPRIPKSVFTNGVDEAFLIDFIDQSSLRCEEKSEDISIKPLEILYAGNVGEGQGLENIIPQLAMRLGDAARIRIIGAGGKLSQLESKISSLGCTNIIIQAPIARNELLVYYRAADVLFLHLNNYSAFLKVLPSKIFEYGALGKPILAGVSGYAKIFIEGNVENAEVFLPCDVEASLLALKKLEIKTQDRNEFVSQYNRHSIMDKMADSILQIPRILR
jgi:hypothetical protein